MDDAHVRLAGEALAQNGDQPVIELDSDDAPSLLRDQLGQHTRPGADLKHGVGGGQIGRSYDPGAVRRINEEVLAQAFLGVNAEGSELGKRSFRHEVHSLPDRLTQPRLESARSAPGESANPISSYLRLRAHQPKNMRGRSDCAYR